MKLWTVVMCDSLWCTVYPKKYAHGFVVLCFVVVMQSFIMNSHEVFIHIHQGCFAGTGAIVRLPQCQWSKPDGYGKISQYITTTKHSKAKTVCIFLGIYCTPPQTMASWQGRIFPQHWSFVKVVHWSSVDSLYKGPGMQRFGVSSQLTLTSCLTNCGISGNLIRYDSHVKPVKLSSMWYRNQLYSVKYKRAITSKIKLYKYFVQNVWI